MANIIDLDFGYDTIKCIDYGSNISPRYAIKKDHTSPVMGDSVTSFNFFRTKEEAVEHTQNVYNEWLDELYKEQQTIPASLMYEW